MPKVWKARAQVVNGTRTGAKFRPLVALSPITLCRTRLLHTCHLMVKHGPTRKTERDTVAFDLTHCCTVRTKKSNNQGGSILSRGFI